MTMALRAIFLLGSLWAASTFAQSQEVKMTYDCEIQRQIPDNGSVGIGTTHNGVWSIKQRGVITEKTEATMTVKWQDGATSVLDFESPLCAALTWVGE